MEFYSLEPWGFPVEDVRMGVLASATIRAAGGKTDPEDFMLGERGEEPASDAQVIEGAFAAAGVEVVDATPEAEKAFALAGVKVVDAEAPTGPGPRAG